MHPCMHWTAGISEINDSSLQTFDQGDSHPSDTKTKELNFTTHTAVTLHVNGRVWSSGALRPASPTVRAVST